MAASCPGNPPSPAGFALWRGPVPAELTQWAMDLRDHVAKFSYGTTWALDYGGSTVTARKDYHSWTHRGGQLITGICIPGITLYAALGSGLGGTTKTIASQTFGAIDATTVVQDADPLAGLPDPTAAVFGASDLSSTDWSLVALSGLAIVGVVTAFAVFVRRGVS